MRDVDGERAYMKRLARLGEFLDSIEQGRGAAGLQDGVVTEVRMLMNDRENGDTLLVVKARVGSAKFVAFVGARNVGEAVLVWRQKDLKKGLKWREDVPWGERG